MTTYAKYADIYRQRLAHSQDARPENSGHVSPVRSQSAAKGSTIVNQLSLRSAVPYQAPSMVMSQTQSPNSLVGRQRRSLDVPTHTQMAQDRAAYMTFLEIQLERVTQACKNALSFQDKVDVLSTQVHGQDEKVTNIGRLVKLLQSYSEAQEEEQHTLKLQVRSLGLRLEEVSQFAKRVHEQQLDNMHVHQASVGDIQESGAFSLHTNSVSPKRSHLKSKRPGRHSDRKTQATMTIGQRVSRMENQLKSKVINHLQSSSSFGTLDHATAQAQKQQPNLNQMREDLNNFAQEVDQQMRDVEIRVVTNLTQHLEETNMHTNSKIDEALLLLDQKVTKVEQLTSASHSRSNVINSTQIVENGRINPARMEAALNDWLSKVEEQVIQIEDKVNSRAAQIDLKSLERRVLDQSDEREVRFCQLEQYCQRMVEEGHSRYEDVQNLSLDWEDRFLQIQRQVETSLEDQSRVLASGLTTLDEETTPRKDLSGLRTLEKKIAKRLDQGVERLGDIIKDLAKAQRRLETRANNLELKVFGQVRSITPIGEPKRTKKVSEKGQDSLLRSAQGTARNTGSIAKARILKNSATLRNSQSVKSPTFNQASSRRIPQKSLSPPVKDGSQGPIDRRASSNTSREKSQKSFSTRSKGAICENDERSTSAQNHYPPDSSFNVFKTSFKQRMKEDEPVSPKEILRRARDKSVRDLSQSFNGSCSRSQNSHRLQSLVDIETASPDQHRLSQRQQDSASATLRSQEVSILNGPVSGQKNIVAQNMTQNFPVVAKEQELEQFRRRQSGPNTGREYLNQANDARSTEVLKAEPRIKNIKNQATCSNKSRKAGSRENRSTSKVSKRDKGQYSLQDLEHREKSYQRKLGIKKESTKTKDSQGRDTKAVRRGITNQVSNEKKDRSLSQRTFKKMASVGQTTLMAAAARGSNATNVRSNNANDVSYGSYNESLVKRDGTRKQSTSRDNSRTLSPSRTSVQVKTTKSMALNSGAVNKGKHIYSAQRPRILQRSNSVKSTRGRSQSVPAITEPAETRKQNSLATVGAPVSSARHVTAAQEIFHQPFDYQQSSTSQLAGGLSRRSSNHPLSQTQLDHQCAANLKMIRQSKNSFKRQRSTSIEQSREERRSKPAIQKNLNSARGQGPAAQLSSQKTEDGAAGKTVKSKLQRLKSKKSNQRLANLEKMYRELTETETNSAHQV